MNEPLNTDRLREWAHTYELGLLSDDDRRAFELYLLEHEEVLAEIKQFRKVIDLLTRDAAVERAVTEMAGDLPVPQPRRSRRFRRLLIPSVAAAAILLLYFVLLPWKIDIQPDLEAIASHNRILIMYFDAQAGGDDRTQLGEMLARLVMDDLDESRYLQVIPSDRLDAVLEGLGLGRVGVNRDTALAAAREANAAWLLIGSMRGEEPCCRVETQLIDVRSGKELLAINISGRGEEGIFDIVDSLTVRIKEALHLPRGAMREADPPVTRVTSSSTKAYRFYIEGVNFYSKFYWHEARAAFEMALQYDSTMPMAYYYLSELSDRRLINKAVKYANRASRKQRLYIMAKKEALDGDYKQAIAILENLLTSNPDEAMAYYLIGEHLYVLKHYPEAIASLTRAAGFNPRLKLVYNVLAYAYNAIGDQTNALAAIDAYIRLAPGEANPYDSRGDFCAMAGRIQEAIEAYRNALAIKPDFGYTQVKLGSLYFFRGEADSAAEYFRAGCRGREYASRSEARLNLACLSLSIGKVGAAMTALDDNIVADRIENGQEKYPSYRFVKAYILELLGQGEEALAEMRQSVALHRINLPQYFQHARAFYAEMLVRQGQIDAARAVLDTMVSDTASPNIPRAPVWYAAAAIAGAEHDYSTAVEYYTRAVAADPTFHLPGRFSLAQALVASRDDERAAVVFSELLANFYQDYALWTLQVARSRYALAVTYERLGRVDDAVMQYAAFLHQWQDADREVADVIDAKRRMARLQSRP